MCIIDGCITNPIYNYEGETKRLYCLKHKLNGMINVKHKTCNFDGCKTRPTYNYENETKPLYCSIHRLHNMIDITHLKCIENNCKNRASFNNEKETKPLYCSKHKLHNMIDIKNLRCIYPECLKNPNYNYEGQNKRLYCVIHKLKNMVDISHKKCKTHLCGTRCIDKYDGYCLFCYMNLYPDKPVYRNYKTKEYSVVEYVKNKYPDFTWVADKIIKDGCSKRRPDLLLDLGYQVIIVEIDENQHIDYDCSCENKRIMELSQDVNHRPIVFIRFNPDDYTCEGKNITSCWGVNKQGICVVKKSKKKEWEERLEALNNQISYWSNPENKTEKTIELIQLYYDN